VPMHLLAASTVLLAVVRRAEGEGLLERSPRQLHCRRTVRIAGAVITSTVGIFLGGATIMLAPVAMDAFRVSCVFQRRWRR